MFDLRSRTFSVSNNNLNSISQCYNIAEEDLEQCLFEALQSTVTVNLNRYMHKSWMDFGLFLICVMFLACMV